MPEVADTTRQSLAALGVSTPTEVAARFDALCLEFDRSTASARDEASWKALRDAWLGRKSGVLNRITEQWLKPAPPDPGPQPGGCRLHPPFREPIQHPGFTPQPRGAEVL